jgi:hypothetical protein
MTRARRGDIHAVQACPLHLRLFVDHRRGAATLRSARVEPQHRAGKSGHQAGAVPVARGQFPRNVTREEYRYQSGCSRPFLTALHVAHVQAGHTTLESLAQHGTHRGPMEFEAEATAYLVGQSWSQMSESRPVVSAVRDRGGRRIRQHTSH